MKKVHSGFSTDSEASVDGFAARSVARRTLVQGAAWSVPVIAVAVATPAAAASTEQQPDLDITYFETGPQDGNGSQWPSDNGEPGYYQNKPLVYHLEIMNHGPGGSATQFTVDVQTHNVSYKNGTLHVIGNNADDWEIVSIKPTPNNTNTFTLRWTGVLEPGATVPLWLNFSTAENPPSDPVHVVPLAAITSVLEGDRYTDNNSQQGTLSYWVKHT